MKLTEMSYFHDYFTCFPTTGDLTGPDISTLHPLLFFYGLMTRTTNCLSPCTPCKKIVVFTVFMTNSYIGKFFFDDIPQTIKYRL